MANRIWLAARRVGVCGGLIGGLALGACVPQVSNHGYRLDEAALAQIAQGAPRAMRFCSCWAPRPRSPL